MVELRKGEELAGYRLDEPIGAGGMGFVFRATQLSLGRIVALKLIRPDESDDDEMRKRFVREARLAAATEHPNVLPIYDVGQVDGLLFIAMRYIEGEDLHRAVRSEGRLQPQRAVWLVRQVAAGLDAAHARDIVHRDVKPQNILLALHSGVEHAYLADFGLSRVVAQSGLTQTGRSLGTPPYMSPEQILGKPVDGRTDVYALGAVLFEMLTGQPPFVRQNLGAMFLAHLNDIAPALSAIEPSLGRGFDSIVARALAKAPRDRYQSAGALAEACEEAISMPAAVGPAVRPPKPTGSAERSAEFPPRITQSYIESRVPRMDAAAFEQFVEVLRARNWNDADLAKRVYPFAPDPWRSAGSTGARAVNNAAVLVLYEATGETSRTRELLRILPGGVDAALTPAELGQQLALDAAGTALPKASVRAVIRNLQRLENRLLIEDAISRRVLGKSWERYDTEQAGRYFLDPIDRAALDVYLAEPGG